jgi:hypothetical protein
MIVHPAAPLLLGETLLAGGGHGWVVGLYSKEVFGECEEKNPTKPFCCGGYFFWVHTCSLLAVVRLL